MKTLHLKHEICVMKRIGRISASLVRVAYMSKGATNQDQTQDTLESVFGLSIIANVSHNASEPLKWQVVFENVGTMNCEQLLRMQEIASTFHTLSIECENLSFSEFVSAVLVALKVKIFYCEYGCSVARRSVSDIAKLITDYTHSISDELAMFSTQAA